MFLGLGDADGFEFHRPSQVRLVSQHPRYSARMPTVELWLFMVTDPRTGKRRRTTYRLTMVSAPRGQGVSRRDCGRMRSWCRRDSPTGAFCGCWTLLVAMLSKIPKDRMAKRPLPDQSSQLAKAIGPLL
jgi:hypothetical protein